MIWTFGEIVDFLRPFQSFTDLFSSHTPSLAAIPLMKTQIRKLCTSFKPNEDERLCLLKQAVLDNLDRRFPVTEAIKVHQILDPDTKGIVPQKEATEILQKAVAVGIKRGVIVLRLECDDEATDGQPQAKLRKMKLEMMNKQKLDDAAAEAEAHDKVGAVEIAHYLTARNHTMISAGNVLEFWKLKSHIFPFLGQLAEIHLSSSSTSVPVECMFSITGLISNSRRSSLGVEKLHRITLIHDNFKFI